MPFRYCPWCGRELPHTGPRATTGLSIARKINGEVCARTGGEIEIDGQVALRVKRYEGGFEVQMCVLDERAQSEIIDELVEHATRLVQKRLARG
jgi:hypothetical protein